MSSQKDVIIVGAGAVGLLTGYYAVSSGFNVMVLEEHHEVGLPCHCAGVVSISGLEKLGVKPRRSVLNKVRGAYIKFPSGESILIARTSPQAYILDRELFDKELASLFISKGGELCLGSRVISVSEDNHIVKVRTQKHMEKGSYCVIAEGLPGKLAHGIGFDVWGLEDLLVGVQLELEGVSLGGSDLNYVKVFLDPRWHQGLFAWLIPLSKDKVRIGTVARTGRLAYVLLKRFMRYEDEVKRFLGHDVKVTRLMSGLISLKGLSKSWVSHKARIALVGDVAGHSKPTTGGGVVMGGLAAQLLVDKIKEGNLKEYRDSFIRRYGKEYFYMSVLRKVLDHIGPDLWEIIERCLGQRYIKALAIQYGDMDFQSTFIAKSFLHGFCGVSRLRGKDIYLLIKLTSAVVRGVMYAIYMTMGW
ncbi:MAG: hypothetical protein DRN15_03385 [Thermoprotei archaeon]|nr:MAG: hypothetical protein DRN15_03385 [Thermoprotei archaeon]